MKMTGNKALWLRIFALALVAFLTLAACGSAGEESMPGTQTTSGKPGDNKGNGGGGAQNTPSDNSGSGTPNTPAGGNGNGGGNDTSGTVNTVAVTGVSLKTSTSLVVGSTEILIATITPSNATNQNVTWGSSNTSVATVTEGGMVIAVAAGNATITVTTDDGKYKAVCAVTVRPIVVSGVTLKESTYLVVGNTETLFAIIEPDNATNQNVTWNSNNTAVATVSASGVVTAVAAGTATITVTTVDGGHQAACSVTVSNYAVSVTGVSLNKSSAGLVIGGTEDLTATITPYNATNQNITWNSSNTTVATVSAGGVVTAKNVGTTTITVTTYDGSKTASCNVTVNPKVITFTVDPIHVQTYTGSVIQPVVTVRDGSMTLALNTDYTVTYTNNINVGNATVTISGVGNYAGSSGSVTFTINVTPKADDFIIIGTGSFYYDGNPKSVTITPKTGKSNGTITVKYNGSTTVPSADGEYTVTFDVAAATGFNAVIELAAGTLKITPFTSIYEMKIYLQNQPANTNKTAYNIKLNVSKLGDSQEMCDALFTNKTKYVSLDLSGSTFYSFPTAPTTSNGYFQGCPSLTSVTIPNSVTSIERVFGGCTSLTSVTIPDSVTSIGNSAFSGCTGLTSITIPNSVTRIWGSAFAYCTSLTNITIPNSVTYIVVGVFRGCTGLTAINVDSANASFSSVDGVLYNKNKTTLIKYPQNKAGASFTIPNSVTIIGKDEEGEGAFSGCTSLTSITIPNSVTSIGEYAFSGCTSLTSVIIGNKVTSIGESAFYKCTSLTSVTIPSSVTSIGNYAFGISGLTSVTIPSSVTSIGIWAFSGCTSLASITIPNSVTSIGYYTFSVCTSLTSVTIPDSVTSIGEYAFSGCTSLTSVIIGNKVTSIAEQAFRECSSLASITIPNSVTSIGNYAFEYCTCLISVTFQGTIPSSGFDERAFGSPIWDGYIGDLRVKFYASNSSNGTPGTYKRASNGKTWTKL